METGEEVVVEAVGARMVIEEDVVTAVVEAAGPGREGEGGAEVDVEERSVAVAVDGFLVTVERPLTI